MGVLPKFPVRTDMLNHVPHHFVDQEAEKCDLAGSSSSQLEDALIVGGPV